MLSISFLVPLQIFKVVTFEGLFAVHQHRVPNISKMYDHNSCESCFMSENLSLPPIITMDEPVLRDNKKLGTLI